MTQKHTFLAFDCGATSGRAVLATFDGGRSDERVVPGLWFAEID